VKINNIYVNGRFLLQTQAGVQRYSFELTSSLLSFSDISVRVIVPRGYISSQWLSRNNLIRLGFCRGIFWEQAILPLYLKMIGSPLLVCLGNTAPILYSNKIVAIHDISFVRFSESYSLIFRLYYNALIPLILRTTDTVITVSEFSRIEISDYYRVDSRKINVVYNAISKEFRPAAGSLNDKYILSVGTLSRQKNVASLIKAFNMIKNLDMKLYLVGSEGKNFRNPELGELISNNANIVRLGRVSDEELVRLYSNAVCFVFPSLYEGFGIPPLEAQACGCPCIVSNSASMPEVYRDSVLYINPYDSNDISEKISMLFEDVNLQKVLIRRGFENIKRFSWAVSAKKIRKIVINEAR